MKLHLERFGGAHAFTGYGPGYVMVDGRRYERSLIVLPDRIQAEWPPKSVHQLTDADLATLTALEVDILLLGTGAKLVLPSPALASILAARGVGLEVMDSYAAARTYNILLAEGRRVAAALML